MRVSSDFLDRNPYGFATEQKMVDLQHNYANMQLLWPGFLCVSEISTVHNTCLNKKCWQKN